MRTAIAASLVLAAAACTEPAPQPLPNEMDEVVPGTRVDPVIPPGAAGNESVNYAEGSVTPAERGSIYDVENRSPAQVAAAYAERIAERRFDEAYRMWAPQAADFSAEQFAAQFENYDTIDAAIGRTGRPEGAAGSIYADVQLTLSGQMEDGSNYVVTGPVTLRRVNDVPGSTPEQRRWRIAKMVLTADPTAAEALVEQRNE